MPGFTKPSAADVSPFGKNVYLRSTQDKKVDSGTFAASTMPAKTIDGNPGQKVLQPGTVIAKITSGPETGKFGPFQAGATDGRQTLANIAGLCDTFLPWQLMERDVEIGITYECTAVQAWCLEAQADGTFVALTNATAAAMLAQKSLDILFR